MAFRLLDERILPRLNVLDFVDDQPDLLPAVCNTLFEVSYSSSSFQPLDVVLLERLPQVRKEGPFGILLKSIGRFFFDATFEIPDLFLKGSSGSLPMSWWSTAASRPASAAA